MYVGDDGCGGQSLRTTGSAGCTTFRPEWPSTSPYVTSVGGTIMGRIQDDGNGDMEEVVSDVQQGSFITTGGGFSTRYDRPYYQDTLVNNYLKNASLPPFTYFRKEGRGFPDISAIATNYIIRLSPRGFIPIAGTSASTPAVAGMFSLINDVRLRNNLPSLGFVNPLLYRLAEQFPHVFHDVTNGVNNCSAIPEKCCPYGFEATEGWDPATGVGTPNVTALIELLGSTLSPFHSINTAVVEEDGTWKMILVATTFVVAVYFLRLSKRNYGYIQIT